MLSGTAFESDLIAIGDIVPDEVAYAQPNAVPDPLTQLRTSLQTRNILLNSKPIDKTSKIYFESYAKLNRKSYGLHDQYDALIHQTRYSFASFSAISSVFIHLLGMVFLISPRIMSRP